MVRPTLANELLVAAGSFSLITRLPMNEGLFGEGAEPGVAGFLGVAGPGVTGATGVPLAAGRARSVSSGCPRPRGPDSDFGGYAARCQPMYEEAPGGVSRIESCHESSHESLHESEQDMFYRDHGLQLTGWPPQPP